MVTSRREAKGKKDRYLPEAPWTCLHLLTQLWSQQCPPEMCSGPPLFLWGIWSCFFRPISNLMLPQEPSLCLFSCNRIHTWSGYILCFFLYTGVGYDKLCSAFPKYFSVWGGETWQFSFSLRCHTTLDHGGAVKVLLPFSGLSRRLQCCSVTILRKLSQAT